MEKVEQKRKIYLAGPWFSDRMKQVMNYLEYTNDVFTNRRCDIYFPIQHTYDTPRDTFLSNIKAIDDCDMMIACISEKDTGTAFEIGYARAKNIPVFLLVNDINDMNTKTNIMLAYATDGVIELNEFANVLVHGIETVPTFHHNNSWEGKE